MINHERRTASDKQKQCIFPRQRYVVELRYVWRRRDICRIIIEGYVKKEKHGSHDVCPPRLVPWAHANVSHNTKEPFLLLLFSFTNPSGPTPPPHTLSHRFFDPNLPITRVGHITFSSGCASLPL